MTAETAASCVQNVQSVPTGVMPEDNNQQLSSKSHGNGNNASGSSNKSAGVSGSSSLSSSSPTFYDIEHARMETWLDEHPEFVNNYFLR